MKYPYIFLSDKINHQPVFYGLHGDPLVMDMSSKKFFPQNFDIRNQIQFQQLLEEMMGAKFNWGVSCYLENREWLLSDCPQMLDKRFYHLGIDVIVKLGTVLHSPLDATVFETGFEPGKGTYGAYVILQHQSNWFETFYSLYGHLNRNRLPKTGRKLEAGEGFAEIGDFDDNGDWFYHTHIQVITQKGIDQGFKLKGYCSKENLSVINDLCPSPLPLFNI